MDNPALSRCQLLDFALQQLKFREANYTFETNEANIIRSKVQFAPSTGSSPTRVHTVLGGWFPTIETARENAASCALDYLHTVEHIEIHDMSYISYQNWKKHNDFLSRECTTAAQAADTLILYWSSMTVDMERARRRCKEITTFVRDSFPQLISRSPLNTALYHIQQLRNTLQTLCQGNKEDIRTTRRPIDHFLNTNIQHNNDVAINAEGTSLLVPIVVAPTFILQQLLSSLDMPEPAYRHHSEPDGSVISSCSFQIARYGSTDQQTQTIYGQPSLHNHSSDENAALRSLQYISSHFHIDLDDYNYHLKDQQINRNRCLLEQEIALKTGMVEAYNLWREAVLKLSYVLQKTEAVINTPIPVGTTQDIHSVLNHIIHEMGAVHRMIEETHSNALNILDTYDHIKITTIALRVHVSTTTSI